MDWDVEPTRQLGVAEGEGESEDAEGMMTFVPHPSRFELGFTDAVKSAFEFLRCEHGFDLAQVEEPTFVRFVHGRVFVNVFHGRGDYVVSAELGRRLSFGIGEDIVTMYEVLGSLGALDKVEVDKPAETSKEVAERVGQLAAAMRTYGTPWLRGDRRAFADARRFRSRQHSRRG